MKKLLSILCCLTMVLSLSTRLSAEGTTTDRNNYGQSVEFLERALNRSNTIEATSKEDFTFGTYGRVHFDGWHATLTDYQVDGLHITMTFKAEEGYKLPSRFNSRFVYAEYDENQPLSYTVHQDTAVLDFYVVGQESQSGGGLIIGGGGTGGLSTSTPKDVYYATPVLVYVAGIEKNVNESQYLKDYVFTSVTHKANYKTGYLGYEHTIPGVDFRLEGSRTYLVRKNSQLKVYVREQNGFAPMEVQVTPKVTTGVSDSPFKDYKNRYLVFDIKGNNLSYKEVVYQPTYFSIYVYNYNTNQWTSVGAYDYYHQDQSINIFELMDQEMFQLDKKQITSFNIQTYQYPRTTSQMQQRTLTSVEVSPEEAKDYMLETRLQDYDFQWENTAYDQGFTTTNSSLRARHGDVYITPRFTNEYLVQFLDHDGTLLKSESVLAGHDATAPVDPEREDFEFTGWDVDFTNVTSDLTVNAQYRQSVFTVTFVDHDGTLLDTQRVARGDDAVAPIDPTREGFEFTGWDKSFENIQTDLVVTALYNELPEVEMFTVTFVDYDNRVLSVQRVERGQSAVAPVDPTREGFEFIGWDTDFSEVQSDLRVYAQYDEIPVQPEDPTTPVVPVTPPTPPTPPTTPTQTPTTPTPTPTNPVVEIEDPTTPLAPSQPDTPVNIEDPETPLARAEGSWALVNLIATVVTVALGLIILIGKLKKEEDQEQEETQNMDEKEKELYKRRKWTKVLGTLIAILSVIVFILTEDMSLPMVMVDKWTVWMVVMALANAIVLVIGRHWKDNDDENDQELQTA